MNVDLCFIPTEHTPQDKLPAVSGSSGRLVVERCSAHRRAATWPGWIFTEAELDYAEAMQGYMAATRHRLSHPKSERGTHFGRQSEKQALKREEEALREERYRLRERRKQEDAVWQAFRKQRKALQVAYQALPKENRQRGYPDWNLHQQAWLAAWEQRRVRLQTRQAEDRQWRAQRQQFRERARSGRQVSAWLALLVVVDNCTRQCLGLPLFVAGPKVTAEMVVQALEILLPPELEYLISDQGSHFRTATFAKLVQRHSFFWIPIARHRAQSNGIAERFIRTLKEWLADKSWLSSEQLSHWLALFLSEYNHRPHQGLPIPGLSPKEFANRVWLM